MGAPFFISSLTVYYFTFNYFCIEWQLTILIYVFYKVPVNYYSLNADFISIFV